MPGAPCRHLHRIGGFGMFMMAINIALMRFGVLIALTVMCALLVDLIILPAIIRLIYPAGPKKPATMDETPEVGSKLASA